MRSSDSWRPTCHVELPALYPECFRVMGVHSFPCRVKSQSWIGIRRDSGSGRGRAHGADNEDQRKDQEEMSFTEVNRERLAPGTLWGFKKKKKQLVMLQKCKEVSMATDQKGGIHQTITWLRKGKKQLITTRPSFCARSQWDDRCQRCGGHYPQSSALMSFTYSLMGKQGVQSA